jgi:hypothetical protein
MSMEEAHPEAAALLAAAGWAPHDGWNVFTRGTLVMGFQPDGQAFHVKNWAAIAEGHPQWSADTPDTAEEAVAWLVERFKPAPNDLTTEATLDPVAFQSEEVENLQDESNGETGEETQAAEREGPGSTSELLDAGCDGAAFSELEPIDADFTIEDLGGPDETLELPAPDPEDFAPEDFAHDPEPEAPQDRFIGLDDLDRVRSLRIGDVATEALRLTTMIEQAVSEQEGEFSNIQAYVVSNLDKHTGAFTPQDDASRATYGRFLELSSARSKIALIDARRKDATALLIAAGRDEVVSFDVQAAFA